MMLKIVLFVSFAVGVMARTQNFYGECSKDSDMMEQINEKMEEFKETLIKATDVTDLDISKLLQSDAIANICTISEDVLHYILELAELVGTCYDPALKSEIEAEITAAEGILTITTEFVCNDGGDKIIEFYEADGFNCLFGADIEQCFKSDYKFNQETADKVNSCVLKEMNECPSSTPAAIFDSWYNQIRNKIPTAAERKSKSSGVTISGATSLYVLPITYAVLSYFN